MIGPVISPLSHLQRRINEHRIGQVKSYDDVFLICKFDKSNLKIDFTLQLSTFDIDFINEKVSPNYKKTFSLKPSNRIRSRSRDIAENVTLFLTISSGFFGNISMRTIGPTKLNKTDICSSVAIFRDLLF